MSNEAQELPRWDMTNVYPGIDSPEYEQAFQRLETKTRELEKFIENNHIDPEQPTTGLDSAELAVLIAELINRINASLRLAVTMEAYLSGFVTTDSRDTQAQKALSVIEQIFVRLTQQETLFQAWIGAQVDRLPHVIGHNEVVKQHAFILNEAAEQSRYLMSSAEENLAAELNLSGAFAWQKLQGVITSQLSWDIEDEKGETKKLPMTAIINLRSHSEEVMRRRGYEAEIAAWGSVENQVAACFNGVKGAVGVLDRRRGRRDSLHTTIDQARMDQETLDAMLGAMKNSLPMFRKYYKSKARKLGKESLPWWDIFAPTGKSESSFSYPEAQGYVLEVFAKFTPDLAVFAQKAFDNNWIDVGPREGKRVGAFCMGLPQVEESRVLLNFEGNLDWVFTLAHELGHAYHNEQLIGRTILQRDTPFTLAEMASTLCETIVTQEAINNAAGPEEELAILETSLIGESQVVVDIYSRYLFEKEVFERRAGSELSAEDFNTIMEESQKTAYGDGLDEDYLHKYMWTWKPHYYRPGLSFYNYPYAFGLLFGTGLYAVYKERGVDFIPQYKDLLSSTGLGTAAELAARFDIDLHSSEFWQGSLDQIGKKIERYIAL